MRMSAPGSSQEAEGDLADTGTRVGAGVSTTDQKITNIEDQNLVGFTTLDCFLKRI